jgi:hypothetical protein
MAASTIHLAAPMVKIQHRDMRIQIHLALHLKHTNMLSRF